MSVHTGPATERLKAHIEDVLEQEVAEEGSDYKTCCQAHADTRPSLIFKQSGTRCVITCRTGCDFRDITREMKIPPGFLKDDWTPTVQAPEQAADGFMPCGHPRAADYPYTDLEGYTLYTKSRCAHKAVCERGGFFLWHTGEDGRTAGGIAGRDRVLYRQVELAAAVAQGRTIYVVEGEKDADNGWARGMASTTLFDGAKKGGANWKDAYTAALEGADVVVIADRDPVGLSFARGVSAKLTGRARSVRTVQVHPEAGGRKADLSDHLAEGFGPEDLVPLEGEPAPDQGALFAVPGPGLPREARDADVQDPPRDAMDLIIEIIDGQGDAPERLLVCSFRMARIIGVHPAWRTWAAGSLIDAGVAAGLGYDDALSIARHGFTAGEAPAAITVAA